VDCYCSLSCYCGKKMKLSYTYLESNPSSSKYTSCRILTKVTELSRSQNIVQL